MQREFIHIHQKILTVTPLDVQERVLASTEIHVKLLSARIQQEEHGM